MFIYLDRSLLPCIQGKSIPHDIIRSIEALSFILRSGVHIVSGERDVLSEISDKTELSLPCRAIFRKAAARCSQVAPLLSELSTYALVDYGRNKIEKTLNNSITTIKIPIEKIIDLSFQSSAEIVFEDINDIAIYKLVVQWYINSVMNSKNIPLRYKKVQGGGNRTYDIYQEKQSDNDNFCLCITDSDKKYPNDNSGETSKKVREIEDLSIPLSFHLDLDFHEIENLLPLSFLAKHAGTPEALEIISILKTAERNGHPEAKLYWDYKKGLRNYHAKNDGEYRNYWYSALGIAYEECQEECSSKKCTCYLIEPWPLKTEIKRAIETSPNVTPTDCEKLNSLWQEIAQVFISWTIAAVPQNT